MSATRSQLSVEFIILFSGVLLIFVVLFSTYFDRQEDLMMHSTDANIKEIVQEMAFTVNGVYLSGKGENKSVIIPSKLNGFHSYTLDIYNNSLWLFWDEGSYSYPLITQNVSINYSSKSQFVVHNSATGVYIS